MEILVDIRQRRIEVDQDELRRKTAYILEGLGCKSSAMISISVVDSKEMARLNDKYLGRQGPTNVLAFSQLEGEDAPVHRDLLGDVVICADVAVDDAGKLGYSHDEMIAYLLIHGILHLVGYDHHVIQDAAAMEAKVQELFHRFYPPANECNATP
jgi:probable rRNA maturation factor